MPKTKNSSGLCRVSYRLPFPPSVNQYWRWVHRRMVISKRGQRYAEEVKAIVNKDRHPIITEPISVLFVASQPDNKERDLDNLFKAVFDALERAKVYENDSQIFELKACMSVPDDGDGHVFIELVYEESV